MLETVILPELLLFPFVIQTHILHQSQIPPDIPYGSLETDDSVAMPAKCPI